jgi:GNAT superfamily N-acetyltransferase
MAIDTPYAADDRQVVLDVLTAAFMDDPVVCWLYPEADERRRDQADFYRALLTHPAAEAYLAGRQEGASVWLTLAEGESLHGEPPDNTRLRALGEALVHRHPDREPHLYLPCMGATRRGAGLGTAMLRHRLARADADGLAAYLEASSPRGRALYLRHGFEDLGEPVRVAGSPPLWPMWREPNTHKENR